MNLHLENQLFIVCGATSGFGKAIAESLLQEGAHIIAVARGEEKLKILQSSAPAQVEIRAGDMSDGGMIQQLVNVVGTRQLHGIVINAGGPPAKTVLETTLEDWDAAYKNILRLFKNAVSLCKLLAVSYKPQA
jgi:3-oxoacyl-[acyl-carrier protein] reductase